jgi:hypothetical protein
LAPTGTARGITTDGAGTLFAVGETGSNMYLYRLRPNDTSWQGTGFYTTQLACVVRYVNGYVYLAVTSVSLLYRVDPSTGTYTTLTTSHGTIVAGVSDGSTYLYLLQQAGTTFWRVRLSDGQTTTLAALPAATGAGCCMAYDGVDSIYVMRGGGTTFYRYSISGNSWSTLAAAPAAVGDGAALVYDGVDTLYLTRGGNTNEMYRYSISANSWTRHLLLPSNVTTGGSAVWMGRGSMAVVYGGDTAVARLSPLPTFAWRPFQA